VGQGDILLADGTGCTLEFLPYTEDFILFDKDIKYYEQNREHFILMLVSRLSTSEP
jgi:hypothetical protein